jgi:hypothetical protein
VAELLAVWREWRRGDVEGEARALEAAGFRVRWAFCGSRLGRSRRDAELRGDRPKLDDVLQGLRALFQLRQPVTAWRGKCRELRKRANYVARGSENRTDQYQDCRKLEIFPSLADDVKSNVLAQILHVVPV